MLSRKQSELIRVLQQQLEAKERELADTKWVFERFQESPSWKVTAPLRWIARKFRGEKTKSKGPLRLTLPHELQTATPAEAEDQIADEIKQVHSSLFRLSLDSFLSSGQFLHLPNYAAPDVSIIVVSDVITLGVEVMQKKLHQQAVRFLIQILDPALPVLAHVFVRRGRQVTIAMKCIRESRSHAWADG